MPTDARQLDLDFEELQRRLREARTLSPTSGDPIFYFVYAPSQSLTVREKLPAWLARLRTQASLEAEVLSLGRLMWEIIEQSGRWDEWLEAEPDFKARDVNRAVTSVLAPKDHGELIERVVAAASEARENSVLFITDIELLHPFIRTRAIENSLNNKVRRPTVFFYPGRRVGHYGLSFLDLHAEDQGYRSTLIGGVG